MRYILILLSILATCTVADAQTLPKSLFTLIGKAKVRQLSDAEYLEYLKEKSKEDPKYSYVVVWVNMWPLKVFDCLHDHRYYSNGYDRFDGILSGAIIHTYANGEWKKATLPPNCTVADISRKVRELRLTSQ